MYVQLVKFYPGVEYNFFEGGGGFSISFRKLCRHFFRTKLIFRSLPEHYNDPILTKKNSHRQIFEKAGKKAVFDVAWKISPKNCVFFGVHFPSKVVYIGTEGAFRKNLRLAGLKWAFW